MIGRDKNDIDGYSGLLKPYTAGQLMVMYGIKPRAWYQWYKAMKKDLGPKNGWTFNVRQVRIIFRKNGPPPFDEFGNPSED
jgi:hypothetical protein